MGDAPKIRSATEAVGIFDSSDTLEAAIDELLSNGFDRAELSLLASQDAVDRKLDHLYARAEELEDNPDTPRAAYVSRESLGDAEGGLVGGLAYVGALAGTGITVAAGGPITAAIASAAVLGGTGSLIGVLLAKLLDDHHADHINDQLERGGLILWVRTWDPAHEEKAKEILTRHYAHDVHLHAMRMR